MSSRNVPRPTQANNLDSANAATFLLVAVGLALTLPGATLGCAVAFYLWKVLRPPVAERWLVAGLGAVTVVVLRAHLVVGWPVRLAVGGLALHAGTPVTLASVVGSVPV